MKIDHFFQGFRICVEVFAWNSKKEDKKIIDTL